VEALRAAGLILGGNLQNAIVLDEGRVINPEGLRYADEFVRHKVLDAIGDFALSPIPFLGDVTLVKAGHEIHKELVAAIFANPDNYEVRTLEEAPIRGEFTYVEASFPWLNASFQGAY